MSAKKQTTKRQKSNKKSAAKSKPKRSNAQRTSQKPAKHGLSPRVRAILFGTLAVLFTTMILVKGENVWTMIRGFFFGVFGLGIILVPVFFVYLCIITEKEQNISRLKIKVLLCILTVLFAVQRFTLYAERSLIPRAIISFHVSATCIFRLRMQKITLISAAD